MHGITVNIKSNVHLAIKDFLDTKVSKMCTKGKQSKCDRSTVYACMLDVSKAFDKIHFGKLFKLLVDRKKPAIVICLLLDNYTRQIYMYNLEWY